MCDVFTVFGVSLQFTVKEVVVEEEEEEVKKVVASGRFKKWPCVIWDAASLSRSGRCTIGGLHLAQLTQVCDQKRSTRVRYFCPEISPELLHENIAYM